MKESISHNPLTENISPVFSFSDARHRLKMAWTLPSFNSDGAKPRCVAMISFALAISLTTQAPLKGPAAQIITLYLSYMIWGCTHCVFADEITEKIIWNNRHGRISIPTEGRLLYDPEGGILRRGQPQPATAGENYLTSKCVRHHASCKENATSCAADAAISCRLAVRSQHV